MPCLDYYLEKGIPPEEARKLVERDVFGENFKRDANGRPIEQGIGAPGNVSAQHVAAILKYEGAQAAEPAREALARAEAARAKK